MTDIVDVNIPKPKRGRKKIYTDEEIKEKNRQRFKTYYKDNKDKDRTKHKRYTECYRSYMKLLNLIKQILLAEPQPIVVNNNIAPAAINIDNNPQIRITNVIPDLTPEQLRKKQISVRSSNYQKQKRRENNPEKFKLIDEKLEF